MYLIQPTSARSGPTFRRPKSAAQTPAERGRGRQASLDLTTARHTLYLRFWQFKSVKQLESPAPVIRGRRAARGHGLMVWPSHRPLAARPQDGRRGPETALPCEPLSLARPAILYIF